MRSAVLDNGLRILIQELHTAPLVSVWCWYRVGSGDELPGRTGVSHWVEHMQIQNPPLALEWRMASRAIFQHYFARGYRAVDFFLSREAGRGQYLLAVRG